MKSEKKIKYFSGEEIILEQKKIDSKIEKLELKHNLVNSKINTLLNDQKSILKKQKKIVSLSRKLTRIEIKIKKNKTNKELLLNGELEKHNFFKKIKIWFGSIEYTKQTMIWGFIFIIPWVFGMITMFIPSVLQTLLWSFSSAKLTPQGMQTSFLGITNFTFLFTEYVIDGSNIFSVALFNFIEGLLIDLPVIIIFSVLIAVLLNKKFKGHTVIKAIFFIPVIYNMAVINETLNGSFGSHFDQAMQEDSLFVNQLTAFFMEIGLADSLLSIVMSAVDRIFTIVNLSGIQILIFIAAIQSIPKHLYEAAEVEGATKYEVFWKITIPMITPMILTAAVYTIVDSFTRAPITRFLQYSVAEGNYGLASAISISYFIINLFVVGFVFLLFKGRVFYHDEEK